MKVIQFSLPENFEPKSKIYRRTKIPRCLWISPDTLFTLCEIVLRKLLLTVVPRRKFWSTVISLLPCETARQTVRHQIERPEEFNRFERTAVNYANHWALLTATIQRQLPVLSNVRVGSLVRNKITQLLLDLDCYSGRGSASDCQQLAPFEFPFQSEFVELDDLTSEFETQPVVAAMERQAFDPEGIKCHYCREQTDYYALSLGTKGPAAVQQLMVTGQATSQQVLRSSCRVQINELFPCGCCQAKM
ncbi:uncharacterized protein LOC131677662 [Topomyia yanbarensis]|uniref:uncharacterized protein LOC131677662 n=1 Tax=Topomyia yanbarensis TaxID=2498891 RepID=UPI00273B657E|nr:uncharacterized protein LOC131677662 [Topomyia yanbarensis]